MCSCCWTPQCGDSSSSQKEVLVIGLQKSGKSLLVQQLRAAAALWQQRPLQRRLGWRTRTAAVAPIPTDTIHTAAAAPRTLPTIGTELQAFPLGFIIREVGGVMRQLWHYYYAEAAAIVFVVDVACIKAATAGSSCSPSACAEPVESGSIVESAAAAQCATDATAEAAAGLPSAEAAEAEAAAAGGGAAVAAAMAPPGPTQQNVPEQVLQVLQAVLRHQDVKGKPFCLVLNKADDVDQQEQIGEALTQLLDVLPAGAWHRSQQVNTCCQAVQDAHPAPQHQQQQQHQGVTVLQTSALTGAGMQALLQWLMCTAGWDCNTLLYLQGGMTCLRELLTVQGVAP